MTLINDELLIFLNLKSEKSKLKNETSAIFTFYPEVSGQAFYILN